MKARPRTRSCSTAANAQRRHGTVLVLVLICLIVVVSLVGTMLQSALRARRQLQTERDCRQAELLLQSGAQRAAYRLAAEQDYRGETWDPVSPALAGRGRIIIQAKPPSEPSSAAEAWQVDIVAEFPFGSPRSIRRSYTFPYTPSPH